MNIVITQALTNKVGFPASLNTIFYSNRTGIVGGSRPQPGVSVKSNPTG